MIKQLNEKLKKKEISSEELTKSYLEKIKEKDGEISAYLSMTEEVALQKAREIDKAGDFSNPLTGIPCSIKDLLCTAGAKTTAASKILENFVPPYSATVVQKLSSSPMLGKVNLDEFAMGSSCENSAFFPTKNPRDLTRVPGGSSGGSAASVAGGLCAFSIGTDTGGSIRQPAAFCGVVGLKPTYGRVSRSGVIAYGSSLDTVGPLTQSVEDCALVLSQIAGKDPKDSTTPEKEVPNYLDGIDGDLNGKKIAFVKEFQEAEGLDPEIKNQTENTLKILEKLGCEISEVSIPELKYAIETYYLIAKSEASSNLSRYDGIRYGFQAALEGAHELSDVYIQSRSQGFGPEVKRAIMIGTYTLSAGYIDAYYKKAAKVRNLIKQAFEKVFETHSAILSPVTPSTAFKIGEMEDPLQMYLQDIFTVPANLAGIPSLSLPVGIKDGLPVGVQLMGKQFNEKELFNIGNVLEKEVNFQKLN